MQIDPFFQVAQHPIEIPSGTAYLPVFLKEGDYSIFLFLVDNHKVSSLLQNTRLKSAITVGNKTFVALLMGHYTSCSVRPFRFAGLAVAVEREQGFRPVSPWKEIFSRADRRHMGFHFIDCTVDSVEMLAVGKQAWGYALSMANIDYSLEKSIIQSHVQCTHSNQTLFNLHYHGFRFWRIKSMDYTMFSIRDQQIIRSHFPTRCTFDTGIPLAFRLQAGDSNHSMVRNITTLGLDRKRPLLCLSTNYFQGRIDEGSAVENLQDLD
jgi:hypothetical protein